MPASLPSFSGEIAMKRLSEWAGLLAGLALFLGTLVVAEAFVWRGETVQTAWLDNLAK